MLSHCTLLFITFHGLSPPPPLLQDDLTSMVQLFRHITTFLAHQTYICIQNRSRKPHRHNFNSMSSAIYSFTVCAPRLRLVTLSLVTRFLSTVKCSCSGMTDARVFKDTRKALGGGPAWIRMLLACSVDEGPVSGDRNTQASSSLTAWHEEGSRVERLGTGTKMTVRRQQALRKIKHHRTASRNLLAGITTSRNRDARRALARASPHLDRVRL